MEHEGTRAGGRECGRRSQNPSTAFIEVVHADDAGSRDINANIGVKFVLVHKCNQV